MAEPNVITKKDLIQSAKKCIVENGINKLTLKAVAEGAGVTQGTVYYHFKTKEQLMIEIVKDMCETSWEELEGKKKASKKQGVDWIQAAMDSAYNRNMKGSFYHPLFLSLIVTGLHNDKVKALISELLKYENKSLQQQMEALLGANEFYGLSTEVWSTLMNALIDGLAIQSLMVKDFNAERVFKGLESLFIKQVEYVQSYRTESQISKGE
ncbi:TetR/AcrR family transcriptional regulator [Priestia endophytica]|uniref:TetR/AcrR family transcriptional regulator n=1 Tax=Priestia endophytica TaxID=135735 RepID=UPI000F523639|nr:TetR/AcrR family transcriptional regulator [Priestia endophytica]